MAENNSEPPVPPSDSLSPPSSRPSEPPSAPPSGPPSAPSTSLDQFSEEFYSTGGEYLKNSWADFSLSILVPKVPHFKKPKIIKPELIADSQVCEFTNSILDYGTRLETSKFALLDSGSNTRDFPGLSNCKFFYTIEKMIFLLIERVTQIKDVTEETEIQIAFEGHEIGKRKAFESVINLLYNVIVVNFDPGPWGERYLSIVKNVAEEFGYPKPAPRMDYERVAIAASAPKPPEKIRK